MIPLTTHTPPKTTITVRSPRNLMLGRRAFKIRSFLGGVIFVGPFFPTIPPCNLLPNHRVHLNVNQYTGHESSIPKTNMATEHPPFLIGAYRSYIFLLSRHIVMLVFGSVSFLENNTRTKNRCFASPSIVGGPAPKINHLVWESTRNEPDS